MIQIIKANIPKIIVFVIAVVALLGVAGAVSTPSAYAESPQEAACKAIDGNWSGATCLINGQNPGQPIGSTLGDIVNIISLIVGIAAVIMIVIGGFKFVTSGGDSNAVKSARSTIIYAIVGLIVVLLAQVIVRFVLNPPPTTPPTTAPTDASWL